MRFRARDWAALLGLAYAVLLLIWIPPDAWMWAALGYGLLIVILVMVLLLVIARHGDVDESKPPVWQQALPWFAAALLFAVVAVTAAALETRPGIGRTYVLLAIGMTWSVGLLRAAYAKAP